jgi:hypothetical protein
MWWVWEEPQFPGGVSTGPLQGAYTAMGAGGQYLTVLPTQGLVVIHTTDIERGPADVRSMAYDTILGLVIEAALPRQRTLRMTAVCPLSAERFRRARPCRLDRARMLTRPLARLLPAWAA